jgi:hypothetical protein
VFPPPVPWLKIVEQTTAQLGFVTTGFHVGSMVSPVIVGQLPDRGHPRAVLLRIAGCALVAIAPSRSGCRAAARRDARDRCLFLPPSRTKRLHVGCRRPQGVRVVVELSKALVALAAKRAANHVGRMAMIDLERTAGLPADRTDAALLPQQLAVVGR